MKQINRKLCNVILLGCFVLAAVNALAKGNVDEHHYVKPGAAIKLVYPNVISLEKDASTKTRIEFRVIPGGTLNLTLKATEGVELLSETHWTIKLDQRRVFVDVEFLKHSNDIEHLNFHAEIQSIRGLSRRVVGVAIKPVNMKGIEQKNQLRKTQAEQDGVVIMPAVETIRYEE